MTHGEQDIPQEKKREHKPVYLFGVIISADEDLKAHEEDSVSVNVPISPEKEADADLKTHEEDSVPVDISLVNSGNPNHDCQVTCARINISLAQEEREEEMQPGQYTITKELYKSDISSNSRLTVNKKCVEEHFIEYLSADAQKEIQQGIGIKVRVHDDDLRTEHYLNFKRLVDSSKSYIFNGDWAKDFIRRRDLKLGDRIGLFWGLDDSKLHFSVLQRKS